jgi:hypothetical protein
VADEITLAWQPSPGTSSYAVFRTLLEASFGEEAQAWAHLPRRWQKLERRLCRLEAVVIAWQRDIEQPIYYNYSVTAFNAAGEAIVPTPIPPAED